MKRWMIFLVWAAMALLVQQSSDYTLNFHRDFGFSSGSQVRGKFTVSVVGPMENVAAVTYRIDGQELASVTTAPFRYSFQTGDHPEGWHDLSAVVTLSDGSSQETPARRYEFVSQETEFAVMRNILIPLGVVLGVLTVLGIGSQILMARGNNNRLAPGAQRNYGPSGGAICKRCQRPFAIHWWAPHFGPWKYDRCDHCGKMAWVMRRPLEELRAAEAAEAAAFKESFGAISAGQAVLSPEEQLRRQLDESKYSK